MGRLVALPVAGRLEIRDPWGPSQAWPFGDSVILALSIMVEQPGGPYDVISGWNEGRSSVCCVPSLERLSSA